MIGAAWGLLKSPWLWRLVAVAAVLAGLYALHGHVDRGGYARAQAVYEAEINRLQMAAAAKLATETERVRQAEHALNQAKNLQDINDAKHTQTTVALSARLRAAAGPDQRLRDPHATDQCGGRGDRPGGDAATAASPGATDPAEAGGLLSKQLTEFLFEQAREADAINVAYASCRADAYTVRGAMPP